MKHYVLKHCSHVGWCRECFVLFGSALIGTLCAEKSVLCYTVRIVFVLARGRFLGRLEGFTLSIWNLAFISCLALLSLPSSSKFPFLHSHLLPFPRLSFLQSVSAVSPTLHSDDQLERAVFTLFISSHFPLYIYSLYFVHLHSLLCISHSSFFIFLIRFPTLLPSPSSYAVSSSLHQSVVSLFVWARPLAYSNLPVPH